MGSSDDIFSILIATDNHLGFAEDDTERGNDALNTFEEILELAVEHSVDFILLGGDLFHDNKPSRHTLVSCMQLLRKYTFGDKPVHFDFVSDPTENFPHLKNPSVNYQDPNLNVSIPVFSIHGNHDDPSGLGQFCALDLISTAGLVNYFGRVTDFKEAKISPLLLTKGKTKLAIYGLSAVKDERLFRLFRESKVKMLRPKEDTEDWFNILVLHQNHVRHSPTNYIPEEFLDNFLDLVFWGHEHECLIDPRKSKDSTFYVTQPGSSVATSLCAGEAVKKKVAILEVNSNKHMRMTPLDLKTIRPFIFDDVCLDDHDLDAPLKNKHLNPVEDFIEDKVWSLVEKSKEQLTGHPRQPKKPLIRLRVEYSNETHLFNLFRFGHKFVDHVANHDQIILFRKKKKDAKKKDEIDGINEEVMDNIFQEMSNETKVEDLVKNYFDELEGNNHQLHLLTERGLAHAVSQFIEKDEKDAIHNIYMHQINKTKEHLVSQENFDEDDTEDAIYAFHMERMNKKEAEEEDQEALIKMNKSKRFGNREPSALGDNDDSDSDIAIVDEDTSPHLARGGRGSRGRGRGRGRGASSARIAQTAAPDEDFDGTGKGRVRGRGRGRAAQISFMDFTRSSRRSRKSYFDASESDE